MKNKYQDIQQEDSMVSEPVTPYAMHSSPTLIAEDTAVPSVSAQKYPYDKDMTVDELYSAIVEDIKAIYAE